MLRRTGRLFLNANTDSIKELMPHTNQSSVPLFEKIVSPNRHQIMMDNGLTFFMSAKSRGKGGYGEVYPVYHSDDAQQPSYSLKTIYRHASIHAVLEEKTALEMMGRDTCVLQFDERPSLLTEWQPGVSVYSIPEDVVLSYPIEERLKWLHTALLQLKHMHDNGYMHGDLTATNMILDIENSRIIIIDFGMTHIASADYCYGTDIANLAYNIYEYIFPDLRKLADLRTNRSPIQHDIIELIKDMLSPHKKNIFINDAVARCDSLLHTDEAVKISRRHM